MRYFTLVLIGIAWIAYFIAFGEGSIGGILFFSPFTMLPFLVIALFVLRWNSLGSQVACLVATLAYAAWFSYIYVDVTELHPDPQGPIAFLFVGIYAAPVLFALWLIAYAFEWHARSAVHVAPTESNSKGLSRPS